MDTRLTAREAACRIVGALTPQPPLRVPLERALGSVLAETITSPIDVPFRTNAAMDGYAVRSSDVLGASPESPRRLTVIERIPAGAVPTRAIGPGQCARIFTGAPVPEGADTVIRQEDTDLGEPEVLIVADRDCLANLRQAGEDIPRGAVVFGPGTELRPAHLGVLASLAVTHPLVWRRPRVGIAASGDELARLDQPDLILRGERIASSNTYTLAALIRETGGEPVDLGLARDTPESIRAQLERAAECDLVITSAGISVGEHDHLRGVIDAMGGRIDFWRLRMRPGAPVGFGHLGATPWLGLPGNPVSTMVTFELFGRAAIRVLMGHRLPFRDAIRVRTASAISLGPVLQHFLRVSLSGDPICPTARVTGSQGSGVLTSMALADALLVVPEGQRETPAGSELRAIRLDEPTHRADPAF